MGGGSSKKQESEPEEQRPTKTTHRQRLGDKPVPASILNKEKKDDSNPVPLNYTVDVRIKCKYKSNVRVVHSSYVPTFRSLTKRLSSDYGFDVQLTYEDDDGDAVTLGSQNDLDQLYDYCRRCQLSKVSVFVTPAPSSGPNMSLPGAIYEESVTQRVNDEPAAPAQRIRWRRGEILGEGAFGKVFLALHLDTGALMAVKQITIKQGSDKEVASLMSEIDLMRALRYPHIVEYLGTEKHGNTLSIFLEYVPGGSIASLLSKFGPFDTALVRTYTRQILLGLDHLHKHDVAHRDIKGANILIDNNGIVKLSDFGGSINLADVQSGGGGMQSAKGTAYWMAPEVIRQKASQAEWKKADIWSVACTVVEMVTGKPPWSNYSNPVTALYQIACRRAPPPMPEDMDELGTKFLELCFKPQPDERSSTDELLLHHFVQSAHISSAALDATNTYELNNRTNLSIEAADEFNSSLKESQASPASAPSPTNRSSRKNKGRGGGGYPDESGDEDGTGGKSSSSSSSWLHGRMRRGHGHPHTNGKAAAAPSDDFDMDD